MAEWRLPEVKLEKTPEVLPPLPPPAWKRAEVEGAKKETEEGKICSRAVVLKRGDVLCGNITADDGWVMVSNPKEGFFTGESFTYREVKELPVRSLLIPREDVEYIVEK
ncbi:MAG: hypothetical protein ACTSYD_01460 [Candidatus Heimdallarchaeaceae archaeon]